MNLKSLRTIKEPDCELRFLSCSDSMVFSTVSCLHMKANSIAKFVTARFRLQKIRMKASTNLVVILREQRMGCPLKLAVCVLIRVA